MLTTAAPRGMKDALEAGRLPHIKPRSPAVLSTGDPRIVLALQSTNEMVNREVPYRADDSEFWRIPEPGEPGDCEDIALLKQKRLIERGIVPAGAALLTAVKPVATRPHLVLSVMTEDGDPYILDNFTDRIHRQSDLERAGVRFLSRQHPETPLVWDRLERTAPVNLEDLVKPFDPPGQQSLDWSRWPNFTRREMACRCGCEKAAMSPDFMDKLQELRTNLGIPLPVNSGYRCPEYNARIGGGPEHPLGKAADVRVFGQDARRLLALATDFPRIGVKQHGEHASRFIHLGTGSAEETGASPVVWSYR